MGVSARFNPNHKTSVPSCHGSLTPFPFWIYFGQSQSVCLMITPQKHNGLTKCSAYKESEGRHRRPSGGMQENTPGTISTQRGHLLAKLTESWSHDTCAMLGRTLIRAGRGPSSNRTTGLLEQKYLDNTWNGVRLLEIFECYLEKLIFLVLLF